MSYKFLSFRSNDIQTVSQWDARTLAGEIESFQCRTLAVLLKKYVTQKKLRILEGGCGFGAWCVWLEQLGHDAVGLEHNDKVVAAAKLYKPDVAVRQGDILRIPYPAGHFDAYLSLGVIEHFERGPEEALAEAIRVLKPGGIAFITTPYLNKMRKYVYHPFRSAAISIGRLLGKQSHFWEYRYTEAELVGFIRSAGFEILEVQEDDIIAAEKARHMGLWADWFFLRKKNGAIWELNGLGRMILGMFRTLFPSSWYCSGLVVVASVPWARS